MNSQTFGEKIKALRLAANYTLSFAGKQLACSRKTLSKIEKGEKKANETLLKNIASLYNVSYEELKIKYLSEQIYYQLRSFDGANEVVAEVQKRLKKEGKGTQIEKSKVAIINTISTYFSDKPVEKAWLFGSFARNAVVSKDSDIDIMVVFKQPNKISLFDIIQMKTELADKTGRNIDLVEESQILKSFQPIVQKEKMLVYEN